MKILWCKAHPIGLLIVQLHIAAMPLIFATLSSLLEFAKNTLFLQKLFGFQKVKEFCLVHSHKQGFDLVRSPTEDNINTLGILKCMIQDLMIPKC